jgi:hypothetical protein
MRRVEGLEERSWMKRQDESAEWHGLDEGRKMERLIGKTRMKGAGRNGKMVVAA